MKDSELQIHVVVSPIFSENAYIAHLPGADACFVLDPGIDPESILALLDEKGLAPQAILNTHGHADHIAGNGPLKQAYPDCPLVIGSGDAFKLTDPVANLSSRHGYELISPEADELVNEPETKSWAGIELEILDTPGHSPGHIVFVYKGQSPWIVFGGDVLFQGSIGRTDFPDGSFEDLEKAIHEKLFTLPDDTIVLPGHGPATTVGVEKETNPFVGVPAGFRVEGKMP